MRPEEKKKALMKEIQDEYGLYPGILTNKDPEYPIPYFPETGCLSPNKSFEYDFRVKILENCEIFIKIFESSRNFKTVSAVGNRYKRYIERAAPLIISYVKESDIWVLFVKSPTRWHFLILPISSDQLKICDKIFQEMRLNSTKNAILDGIRKDLNEILTDREKMQLHTPFLEFLFCWVIHHKDLLIHKPNNAIIYK